MLQIEVVIESFFSGRAKGELDSWEESHDGPGHDVGAGVPHDVKCLGVLVREDLNAADGVLGERRIQPNNSVIYFACNSGICESRADRLSDLMNRAGGGVGLF